MLAREHLLLFSGIGRMPATEMEQSGIEVGMAYFVVGRKGAEEKFKNSNFLLDIRDKI